MTDEKLSVQIFVAKAVVWLLLFPLLLVLVGTDRDALFVLSVGAVVQGMLFVLLTNRQLGRFAYAVAPIMFFVGIATAMGIHFQLGYKLERQYALIVSILLLAFALHLHRAYRSPGILSRVWAGIGFQLGLLAYSLLLK